MIDALISGLVGLIEGRYGAYDGEEREAVSGYLAARVEPTQENVARVFDAIRQECPVRFGPPDEATVKKAIVAYEEEYGVTFRPRGIMRDTPAPEPLSEEEVAQLVEIAESAGINTSEDGWMSRYFFRRCGELARAKRFA